jgi:WD40 repeat protein
MINQFTAELTSRGYPYDIKGYENNKICESLNPDIQSVLFIEHAISLLKGRIIDKKGAQEMKQLAYKRPGFSFNSLVFSPQSDRLVAVGSDDENNNELILLDCKTDDTFSFKGSINYRKIHLSSVIFTPDGKSMVIAKDDGWLSLITLNSESGSHDFSTERIKVTNSPLLSVALRPNSKQIIVLTTDILCILPMNDTGDIDTSCQIMRARPEDKNFETFAVSSDGKRIAVATNGGLITYAFDSDGNIYRDRNWNFTHGSINILVFTPDNMKLVAGLGPSKKNELNFFQFKDDQLVHTRFDGYYVSGLAFIPNSKKIIIQGYGEKAFSRLILANISEFERRVGIEFGDLYHPSGGIKFKNLDSPGGALSMVASPNGEKIVVGFKGKLIVWNFLSHKDKKLLNDLRVTLTKDQAKLISILLQKINKNDPIKLLPFEMDDYHELPLAVRDLLLGTGDVSNLLSTTRSFDYYAQ